MKLAQGGEMSTLQREVLSLHDRWSSRCIEEVQRTESGRSSKLACAVKLDLGISGSQVERSGVVSCMGCCKHFCLVLSNGGYNRYVTRGPLDVRNRSIRQRVHVQDVGSVETSDAEP